MLLSITHLGPAASDLGYLLHKHPEKVQVFDLSFGKAHVFYPESNAERCTACLLLDIDSVGLVRNRRGPGGEGRSLEQYVNDRPYVASSFLSVAIAQVYGSALSGKCNLRPELVERPFAVEARIESAPARGDGQTLIRELFEPLGYEVCMAGRVLDERFPDWGESPYFGVTLRSTRTLRELLNHLYVLIPVLDNDKHYWVGSDEVEKLLKRGEGWLGNHPSKEMIADRYLRHKRSLARDALWRLTTEEQPDADAETEAGDRQEEEIERTVSLQQQRHAAVISALKAAGAKRVLDLGCAQGMLIRRLLEEKQFELVAGLDVSLRALEGAERRLKPERMPEPQRARLRLMHGSLMYRDERLAGFDAACLVEVIEHLDPPRLAAMARTVFEFARPEVVVITTPNIEYNVRFETLAAGQLRHRDHRFEWTRAQFQRWASETAGRFGYRARFLSIGDTDPHVGAPTQMGVFQR